MDVSLPGIRPPLEQTDRGTVVTVWVVAGASRREVVGIHGDAIRIRVVEPPRDRRANRAVAEVLRELLGAPEVELVFGASSRRKRYLIRGLTIAEVRRRIG